MSQPSINAFFNVQKRAADHHAAKRRKVVLDEETSTTTSLPKTKEEKLDTTRIRELAKVVVKSTPVSENDNSSSCSSTETPSMKVRMIKRTINYTFALRQPFQVLQLKSGCIHRQSPIFSSITKTSF